MTTIEKLKANAAIVLPENGLEEKWAQADRENRQLVIKLGFDPTAPDLHLGHAVVLKKLKQFQDLGHQIVILVGSFTARIGDPTGKNKSRKPLSAEEVQTNAQTYLDQLGKIIDVQKAKIVFNSDWYEPLGFTDVIQLMAKVTVAQLLQRHDFQTRFSENRSIGMHEMLYPMLQGFDSIQINADIEMGGTDQLFNCTMGRHLQEQDQLNTQIVLCMPLLVGLDGKEKMSKSLNNYIGLTDSPTEMFGKTMSLPDDLLPSYLDLACSFTAEETKALQECLTKGENPMVVKKLVAQNIVAQYHSEEAAIEAEAFFAKQFQSKQFDEKQFEPVAISDLQMEDSTLLLLDLCHQLKPQETRSAIRRLIESGAVQLDQVKQTDPFCSVQVEKQLKIKIGKRHFFELV